MSNARETALLTLYKIQYEGAYSNLALKNQLASADISSKDSGLASALVYGVVQRKNTLLYIISQFSSLKLKRLSGYITLILELGIYQILYMDRIPESAAVNESVKLARRYGHVRSAGFVNALLRNVIRNRDNIRLPDENIKRISLKYSFPEWTAKKWIDEFGEDFACRLMEALNETPKMSLRVNTLKTTREKLLEGLPGARQSEYLDCAVICPGFDIEKSREYKQGLITVQDEAAMLASVVLDPAEGDTVIDMCAAPGGKSTHMAQMMNNKGKIFSFDIHEHKISLIEGNAKRLGIDIISAKKSDALVLNEEYIGIADKILADVPCSGMGIIRRKPDIKWNRKQDDKFFDTQLSILKNAALYLKEGGELVYSTCTVEKEENECVIKSFLEENRDFKLVDIAFKLPETLRKDTAFEGYITLYPNIDKTDGFFIAKFKKV